jgi:integration host factor subunit beta
VLALKKSDLIKKISQDNPELPMEDICRAVDAILHKIVDTLKCGNRVEIRGFGVFYNKYRRSQMAKDLISNKDIFISDRYLPAFKAGKSLRHDIDNSINNYI